MKRYAVTIILIIVLALTALPAMAGKPGAKPLTIDKSYPDKVLLKWDGNVDLRIYSLHFEPAPGCNSPGVTYAVPAFTKKGRNFVYWGSGTNYRNSYYLNSVVDASNWCGMPVTVWLTNPFRVGSVTIFN